MLTCFLEAAIGVLSKVGVTCFQLLEYFGASRVHTKRIIRQAPIFVLSLNLQWLVFIKQYCVHEKIRMDASKCLNMTNGLIEDALD